MKTLLACGLWLTAVSALAAEGMWTLDQLPMAQLESSYDFSPDKAWVDKVQRSSVRLAGGCSGSFVSPDGLVLTNHHCVSHCVAQLSTGDSNLMQTGFTAGSREAELTCPDIEVNQLLEISDVTGAVQQAAQGKDDKAANEARKAAKAALEAACVGADADSLRCDVVTLYRGGQYHLYKYRRFQDVRLAFVPETEIAFFGGDPDNFNFPRYCLDMGLLRVYENGSPARIDNHFGWQSAGAQPGEAVFVTGHPGATQRLQTAAQLATLRDLVLPQRLIYLAELRGLLKRFSAEDPEQARIATSDLFGVENGLKALRGRHQALVEPGFFEAKLAAEDELRRQVDKKKRWRKAYGDAWDAIAASEQVYRNLYTEYSFLEYERGFQSQLFGIARHLVRAAEERPKPDGERLREYNEAALPRLTQQLFSSAPIYPALDKLELGWSLEKLREYLGADHPAVRQILGKASPTELAAELVDGSALADIARRKALWEGGATAVAASTDPMIVFARRVDPLARAVRKRFEDEVESIRDDKGEKIAQAQFAIYGTDTYPDATFTLRLSHGVVRGWNERGTPVEPFTSVAGAFVRATGRAPYELPPSWLSAEQELDPTTRMNFVTTHDIIGGNSGSPVINRDAQVVGLIFDGNIHSLGGAFVYDERFNRAVAVHSAVIGEALKMVYGAQHLYDELTGADGQ